ncbi:uncharacterized protein OCT59_023555 [Rhizophagus irregularis]|uniref:Shc1p n=1 Tax=Rhizophagus irregularis (strain DAOM 197198w) TaxID=1432141 RepID=A0A015K4N0_RHIIW|nr:Shc1p [Rhizophagus irregularis DAOM 197198w]UZO03143.1 hypothetical protein OCT59_023555 [Rhizophagus irregularis]
MSEIHVTKNLDKMYTSNSYDLSHEKMIRIIQNFNKIDMKEIKPTTQNINENIYEGDLGIVVDKLIDLNMKNLNKGIDNNVRKKEILDYIDIHNIIIQEIYNWLLNNQNSSNSIYLLGFFNYHGIITNTNEQKAFELYYTAAELKNMVAQLDIATMYIFGSGIEKNYDKAFELINNLAASDIPSAVEKLGFCYYNGIGTDINKEKAFKLYQDAADLGNSHGIYSLGCCYHCGIGTSLNKKKAFDLYEEAAYLGNTSALNSLGWCYKEGFGTVIDLQKTFELCQKSANLENRFAQYNLGLMYENGYQVEKDITKAIYWYKKSAKQGHKRAKKKLKIFGFISEN